MSDEQDEEDQRHASPDGWDQPWGSGTLEDRWLEVRDRGVIADEYPDPRTAWSEQQVQWRFGRNRRLGDATSVHVGAIRAS